MPRPSRVVSWPFPLADAGVAHRTDVDPSSRLLKVQVTLSPPARVTSTKDWPVNGCRRRSRCWSTSQFAGTSSLTSVAAGGEAELLLWPSSRMAEEVRGEDLDAAVVGVGHVRCVPVASTATPLREDELPVAAAIAAELGEVGLRCHRRCLNTVVVDVVGHVDICRRRRRPRSCGKMNCPSPLPLSCRTGLEGRCRCCRKAGCGSRGVDHVDSASGVDGHAERSVELPVAAAAAAKLAEIGPAAVEDSNAVVEGVGHVDCASGVDGHTARAVELPVAAAGAPELIDVGAAAVEDLNAVVIVSATRSCRSASMATPIWLLNCPDARSATAPELVEVGAAAVEDLNAVVVSVAHVDLAGGVNRHANGVVKLSFPHWCPITTPLPVVAVGAGGDEEGEVGGAGGVGGFGDGQGGAFLIGGGVEEALGRGGVEVGDARVAAGVQRQRGELADGVAVVGFFLTSQVAPLKAAYLRAVLDRSR